MQALPPRYRCRDQASAAEVPRRACGVAAVDVRSSGHGSLSSRLFSSRWPVDTEREERPCRSLGVQPVHGAHHAATAAVQDVRVDHRRGDVALAEQLLHRPDGVAVLEQMRREGMAIMPPA